MRTPSPYDNYPPKWGTYTHFVTMVGPGALGFAGTTADINRFGARYRAAKCFRRIEFEGVTHDTADGYSALCQILLTYSAFEHLLKCINMQMKNTLTLIDQSERDKIQAHLRSLNGSDEMFQVVYDFVNSTFRSQITQHLSGNASNPFYLAGSVRHAFAHGLLAATPSQAPQRSVATVSRYLARVLMRIMDREFEYRVGEFEKELH